MKLEGAASPKDDREHPDGRVNLTKTDNTSFPDEWDPVIENYTLGSNDPDIIDSVARIALITTPDPEPVIKETRREPEPSATVIVPPPPQAVTVLPQTIEEKFNQREKKFTREIPVSGDSVELRFYDNAEIDGDSISLFLNGQLLFTHGSNKQGSSTTWKTILLYVHPRCYHRTVLCGCIWLDLPECQ